MPFTAFRPTYALGQRPEHPLFQSIDWNRVLGGDYAVVDPMDPSAILYLSEKEYKIQIRVSQSQDTKLIVLATAGSDKRSTIDYHTHSQNSPLRLKRLMAPFLNWQTSQLNKLATVNSSGDAAVTLSDENLRASLTMWAYKAYFMAGGSLAPSKGFRKATSHIVKECRHILRHQGRQTLILKLKNALFLLNRYLAGQDGRDPWLLGIPVSLSRSGLPALIPVQMRRRIAAGDPIAIRIMSTLLSSYKAFEGTHKHTALDSVQAALPELCPVTLAGFDEFCKKEFWEVLKSYHTRKGWDMIRQADFCLPQDGRPYVPLRAGPNNQSGLLGAPADALAWTLAPVNWPMVWAKHVGDDRIQSLFATVVKALDNATHRLTKPVHTSKVSMLPEAAGKVRVIAIVDYWTQRLMSPVHEWMMAILKPLATDATFAQEESVERYATVYKDRKHYSVDLKSATDLIPITLYEVMLKGLLPHETVDLWISLLTDRWFHVPSGSKKNPSLARPELRSKDIRYGRGQPMGTLSSWPSMALVHHALVLFSAKRAGYDPMFFTEYRILGDDNVMCNDAVAAMYLEVTRSLCVPTSPAKTLEGKLFIFASQAWREGVCLSPLSLKEEIGIKGFSQRLEMALRAVRRGWLEDTPTVARFLRFLITPQAYAQSLKEFARGKLGHIAQAALISAFGIEGRLLDALGFRGSGCKTLLLAIANKCAALAGDRSSWTSPFKVGLGEINRVFAIHIVHAALKEAKRSVDALRDSALFFAEWRTGFAITGMLPGDSRKGPRGRAILNIPYAEDLDNPVFRLLTTDESFRRLKWSLDQATWPVIEDSYTAIFGVQSADDPLVTDYEDLEELEDAYGGMTFSSDDGRRTSAVTGRCVNIPPIVQETSSILSDLESILKGLMSDDPSPIEDVNIHLIWEGVDEALTILSKIARLPDFSKPQGLFEINREPVKVDLLRDWVRRTRLMHRVIGHWSLPQEFSILEKDPSLNYMDPNNLACLDDYSTEA